MRHHPVDSTLTICGTVLFGGLGLLSVTTPLLARPSIRDAFFAVYPKAVGTVIETVPSQPNHCGVCHYDFAGAGTRNPYGQLLQEALGRFPNNPKGRQDAVRSIETQDADADTFTSLIEVTDTINYKNTPTFPGLSPANVQNVSNVNINEIKDYLVPSKGGDSKPPVVQVIAPNGGEILVGNASFVVRWTATDESGIARIDFLLSDDGGRTFTIVAEGVPNTGAYEWFAPNRPTTSAIFRVLAVDNAFNSGYDDSDTTFWVKAPAGGRVPTTLRDFDQPGSQPFEAGILNHPLACEVCHGNYDAQREPYFNWQGSMMSQASRDPLFEACLAVANQDAPDSGDLCLRCHLPRGWLRGRSVPTSGRNMIDSDKAGVACDLCHRMVDPFYDPIQNPVEDKAILERLVFAPVDFGNGMFVVDPSGARRGPFPDANSGHPILVSPFHREAAFCGTCHDVSNPAFTKDAAGKYPPNTLDQRAASFSAAKLMPIERTYSEWFYSSYNSPQGVFAPQFGGNKQYVSTCQDCHLRDVTGKGCNFPEAPTRPDLPLHDMTGGSTWLSKLMPVLYPNNPDVNPTALNAGALRAQYMLQNAATLAAAQEGAQLKVTVTNESGHKLPTGYPEGRRIWVNVRFFDPNNVLLAESGAYDPNTGVLTPDAQLRVYEAKPGLDDDVAQLTGLPAGPSFHFVLNNRIYKDNRIPPRGFTNANYATFGGAPVGHTYADGQYWDEPQYTIPGSATRAEVRLYYQSTTKEYVEFLRDENATNDRGQVMYDLWNANQKCPPELMASRALTLVPPGKKGDLNCDGVVNFGDITPFVLALSDPNEYQRQFPDCNIRNGDCNGDGLVDFGDINPFVALLGQ